LRRSWQGRWILGLRGRGELEILAEVFHFCANLCSKLLLLLRDLLLLLSREILHFSLHFREDILNRLDLVGGAIVEER